MSQRCGLVRTSLTWTTRTGLATDLVYDVLADRKDRHVGAVRLRVKPRWGGTARITDFLDGRGARRISATANKPEGPVAADRIAVTFRTQGTGVNGAPVSTGQWCRRSVTTRAFPHTTAAGEAQD